MLSSDLEEKIETFITDIMTQDHIPGLSLAIVKDGKIVYAKGFGGRARAQRKTCLRRKQRLGNET
jgi:CubicO group peptidase (beta-lactamase class C family)